MLMWILLMAVLVVLAILGLLYLASRIRKFGYLKRLTEQKKKTGMAVSLLILAAFSAMIWIAWGLMNLLVVLLHLVVFWLISDCVFALIGKKQKTAFVRYYAGAFAIAFTVIYLGSGWYLAHHVWKTTYMIQTEKNVGNLRVAVFSDSHVGTTFHGEGFAKHMKEIEVQHPDVVLVVGDFVDDDTTKEDMIQCCAALGEMETTYGVYYVFGNHDKGYYPSDYRGYDGNELIRELEKNQVHVLQDETELIDDRF